MAVAVEGVMSIAKKFLKGNPGLPKCKPHTVYIYKVLIKNGGVDKNESSRQTCISKKAKRPDTNGIGRNAECITAGNFQMGSGCSNS